MIAKTPNKETVASISTDVDDAGGLERSYWYVAIVNHNAEKKVAERLEKMDIISYIPTQSEIRVWKNGRKVKVERIVIPSIVFINCTELKRREIVTLPFINRFMTNKAGNSKGSGSSPIATIPDTQIEQLRFMLGHSGSPVSFSTASYKKGDLVRVTRGGLLGLVGTVHNIDDKHSELVVHVDFLGNAILTIETADVEPFCKANENVQAQ